MNLVLPVRGIVRGGMDPQWALPGQFWISLTYKSQAPLPLKPFLLRCS